MNKDSLADLEQAAVQRREAVAAAFKQLAVQMQPANLAREATESATLKASEAVQAAASKATTPKGLGVSVAAVAAGTALIAGWRTRLFGLLPEKPEVQPVMQKMEEAVPPPQPEPEASEPSLSEPSLKATLGAAAGLGAAIAVGTALSKMLPVSERERDLLDGVGEELKNQFVTYAQALIQAKTAPGWVNVATTLLGVLAARGDAVKNETGEPKV